MSLRLILGCLVTVLLLGIQTTSAHADATEPSAAALVKRYDEVMAPPVFEGLMSMVAHRQDGSTRSYKMHVLKSGNDKVRAWFLEPAAAKGQEMLRVGDNMWVYMPNLKRSIRIAARESFQGGDFNNGDILRVNYVADYTPKLISADDSGLWALELTAKSKEVTYDRIKLWMSKSKRQPVRAEYYAASGKLLRSAKFEDIKSFRGFERPSRITMRNELATQRYSEMTMLDIKIDVEAPAQRFVIDDLGR
ncbi:MAG TPA: outer membrane lipoprotein-sorting protein [Polyangiaceae bacterium]